MKRISEEEISKSLTELHNEYQKFRRGVFFTVILLVLELILLIRGIYLFSFPLLFLTVLYDLFYVRKVQKSYVSLVNLNNIRFTIGRKLGAEIVDEKSGGAVTADLIREANLIPVDDRMDAISLFMGISGEEGGRKLALCDAALTESFRLRERGRNRVYINCGVFMHIELAEDSRYDFRLFHDEAIPTVIQQEFYQNHKTLKQIPASKLGLSKEYYFFEGSGGEKSLPPEKFVLRFEDLEKYTPGHLAVSVRGKSADIFIRNRFLAMPVSVRDEISREFLLRDPFPEYDMIKDMISKLL